MRRTKLVATALTVQAFGLCMSFSPSSAQTSQRGTLLNRIEDGDYVWSLRFSREEATLLGYGYALLESIQRKCPALVSETESSEVASFFPILTGTAGAANLQETIGGFLVVAASQALKTRAEEDLAEIIDGAGGIPCGGSRIDRIAQNVWRMLTGRRPSARGDAAGRWTFLDEDIVPISTYHRYASQGASLAFGSAADVFEDDVRQLGEWDVTILECRYDVDPSDQSHEEQYYWGPSLLADIAYGQSLVWKAFILSSQERIDRATGTAGRGSGGIIHPFTTYGPPRRECPSLGDPDLSMKRIAVREAFSFPTGRCRPVGNGLFRCPEPGVSADGAAAPVSAAAVSAPAAAENRLCYGGVWDETAAEFSWTITAAGDSLGVERSDQAAQGIFGWDAGRNGWMGTIRWWNGELLPGVVLVPTTLNCDFQQLAITFPGFVAHTIRREN